MLKILLGFALIFAGMLGTAVGFFSISLAEFVDRFKRA